MRLGKISIITVPLLTLGLLAGCTSYGGHGEMGDNMKMDDDHGAMNMAEDKHGEEVAYGEAGMAMNASKTIEMSVEDNAYSVAMINVKMGDTILIKVKNNDDVEHELVIGTMESMAEHRAEMAKMAEMDMKMEDHGAPNEMELPEMASGELVWKFTNAGMFEYACNIPGHYELGMHGKIMVMAN